MLSSSSTATMAIKGITVDTPVLLGAATIIVPAGTPHVLNYPEMDPAMRHQCRMRLARRPHWITKTLLHQDSQYGFYPAEWDTEQVSADFKRRFDLIQGADLILFGQPADATTTSTTVTATGCVEGTVLSSTASMHSTASTLRNESEPLSVKFLEAEHVVPGIANCATATEEDAPAPVAKENQAAPRPHQPPPAMISPPQETKKPHTTTNVNEKVPKTQKGRGGLVGKVQRFFSRWTDRGRVGAAC